MRSAAGSLSGSPGGLLSKMLFAWVSVPHLRLHIRRALIPCRMS